MAEDKNGRNRNERRHRSFFRRCSFSIGRGCSSDGNGDSPLESLVENYQSGVRLLKLCRSKVERAEMKVKEVTNQDGELELRNFTQAEE